MKNTISLLFLGMTLWVNWAVAQDPFTPEKEEGKKAALSEVEGAALSDTVGITIGQGIRAEDIKKHLEILAADDMEGRETGQPGLEKAAEYIARHFKDIGLTPTPNGTYFQDINFAFNNWIDIALTVNGQKFRYMWDFYGFPQSNASVDSILSDEVIFLGYGIDDPNYSDYAGVDVQGKVIMVYQGEPLGRDSVSHLTGRRAYSIWALDWRKKLETAKRYGVKAVIFIEPDVNARVSRYRDRLLSGQTTMGLARGSASDNFANCIYVSKDVAKAIIGKKYYGKFIKARNKINRKGRPRHLVIPAKIAMSLKKRETLLNGRNVMGMVEGSDPALRDEIVIVSAHYDHLGKKGMGASAAIYNGADDNGSGTSTVLDIAEAVAGAKNKGMGPKRSVLFLLLSGEEKGLLGSEYYVNHPVYPLERSIVDVNVDMIGRVDEKHKGNPDYIYVIGANRLSSELHDINEEMNRRHTRLELDYTYNAEGDPNRYYYRSDHYNFAERGIPAIFYFSGVHPDYHTVNDTADKINYEKTAKVGRLIFHTIWELANRPEAIKVDVGAE